MRGRLTLGLLSYRYAMLLLVRGHEPCPRRHQGRPTTSSRNLRLWLTAKLTGCAWIVEQMLDAR